MILSRYTLPLVLLLINEGASKVVWSPCNEGEFDTTLKVDCSNVTVPLDYTQPKSNKTLNLEIVRVPATVKPSKGSIFLLFGGPGYEARQHLVYYGANLSLCVHLGERVSLTFLMVFVLKNNNIQA